MRSYQEEFFRKAVMLPAERKGGLEAVVLVALSVVGFAVFGIVKFVIQAINEYKEKCKIEEYNKELIEKFKSDISVTSYNVFYELIEGTYDVSTNTVHKKVNFIAYDSDKQDICNIDYRLYEILCNLGYSKLRLVKGNNKVKCKEYVFVTDMELDIIKYILSQEIEQDVNFLPYEK